MYKFLVLAALATVAYAGGKNRCPWALGKYPFDDQKFAGEWKVYAGTPHLQKLHSCGKFNFQNFQGKDTQMISYSGKGEDGKDYKGESYAQSVFGKEKAATMLAVFKLDNGPFSSVFKQSIVATDYDNYAIMLSCKNVFDESTKTFNRMLKAGVLVRPDVTLSQDTFNVLLNVLSGYDVDVSTLKMIDHSKC